MANKGGGFEVLGNEPISDTGTGKTMVILSIAQMYIEYFKKMRQQPHVSIIGFTEDVMVKELRSLGLNLEFKDNTESKKRLENMVGENEYDFCHVKPIPIGQS